MYIKNFEDAIDEIKTHLIEYLFEHGIDTSKNFRCLNPNHEDKNPSMGLSKNKKNCVCYSCGSFYNILGVCCILENKPTLGFGWLNEVFKYICNKYKVQVDIKELTEEQMYELDTFRVYRTAAELLQTESDNQLYLNELEKRNWIPDFLKGYSIGVVKDYNSFIEQLISLGYPIKFLTEVCLTSKDLFNENNLIYTWKDEYGRPIGFTARNLIFNSESKIPKYYTSRSSGMKVDIFQKGHRLYNIDIAIKSNATPIYIFEGQADVITACKHGLKNCVAIGGCSLNQEHVLYLKHLKAKDIVLVLDGDKAGQDKLKKTVDTVLSGQKDIKCRVIMLPDNKDPDEFIREKGIDKFKELHHLDIFEWRLHEYSEDTNPIDICKSMVQLIVNESSPIIREGQCRILSVRTGIEIRVIKEELDVLLNEKAIQKSQDKQVVIDKLIYNIKTMPSDIDSFIYQAQNELYEITTKFDKDTLSGNDFIELLNSERDRQELKPAEGIGYKLGYKFKGLEEALRGNWNGTLFGIGGTRNSAKTSLVLNLAYELASNNEDVLVIYHTIDDTKEQLLPRLVAIAEGSSKLASNMVESPLYWKQHNDIQDVFERRKKGYDKILDLAKQDKLIIKDASHGTTIPFIENIITFNQKKYPNKTIVYVLDNFHKLKMDGQFKDERVKWKNASINIKNLVAKKQCCLIATMEYKKILPGTIPSDNDLKETSQIGYDANFTAHVYNDMNDLPHSYTVCHKDIDWDGVEKDMPRIELHIGKNKISAFKGVLFYDFFPSSGIMYEIDKSTINKQIQDRRINNDGRITTGRKDNELDKLYK